MRIAAKVRAEKEAHPERFCADKKCLWRIVRGDGSTNPCRNHPMENLIASFGPERFDLSAIRGQGFRVKFFDRDGVECLRRAGGTMPGSPLRDEAPTLEWAKAIVADLCAEYRACSEPVTAWVEDRRGVRVYEQRVD